MHGDIMGCKLAAQNAVTMLQKPHWAEMRASETQQHRRELVSIAVSLTGLDWTALKANARYCNGGPLPEPAIQVERNQARRRPMVARVSQRHAITVV